MEFCGIPQPVLFFATRAMNTQKATKKSVSFFPKVLEAAERRARKETNGNLSRHIQNLILRDAENTPPPPSGRETIIEELAEQWVPTVADSLRKLLRAKEVNQAELFGRCLTRLRDYLAASRDCTGDFLLVPENKCPVFSEKQRRLGLMAAQGRKEKPSEEARALLEELENRRLEQ
jgi:hypothetical protein